jgi:hypothetical protein
LFIAFHMLRQAADAAARNETTRLPSGSAPVLHRHWLPEKSCGLSSGFLFVEADVAEVAGLTLDEVTQLRPEVRAPPPDCRQPEERKAPQLSSFGLRAQEGRRHLGRCCLHVGQRAEDSPAPREPHCAGAHHEVFFMLAARVDWHDTLVRLTETASAFARA